MDFSTKFMGLILQNPIVIGSSGLTNSVKKIQRLADNGAGAVVLKSLFEEQILAETSNSLNDNDYEHAHAYEYITSYAKDQTIGKYLDLISSAKKAVNIPIIASINCVTDTEWVSFAKKIEDAGADALEVNVSFLPTNTEIECSDYEKLYFDVVKKIKSQTKLPVALKMSIFSSGLANLIKKLSWTKNIDSFVLFNRFYNPDIDIDTFEFHSSNIFSSPQDISMSLRWIALMSGVIDTDLASSTGVHSSKGVIKQLLAGAKAVQVVSAIYQKGPEIIMSMLRELEGWMKQKNYTSIDDFRGKVNRKKLADPTSFERVQFMKYFGSQE